MTRAAIYARVSSAAQRERQTIQGQLLALRAYVAAQGWTLVGEYVDDGRSAATGRLAEREGWARLVADVAAARLDVLAVVDVDRLTRTDDLAERAQILGPLQRAGVRIVTPSGEHDLRTLLGELYVTMQALVGAEENRKRAQRIVRGKVRAIAEGRKPAGPTPYGLAYSRAAGAWSINPVTAPVVREIYARVIAGESCLVIADSLHARAIHSPRGSWTRWSVWRIARSTHTRGQWTADKRTRTTIAVPAIVDESTWHAAQASLEAHGKRGLRRTRHVYLLEGLARCGECGAPIAIRSAIPQRRGRVAPAAYVCRDRKLAQRDRRRCTAPIIRTADLDARVWAAVLRELDDPGLAVELERRAAARAGNAAAWQADATAYRARLNQLDRIERGHLDRHRAGILSAGALDHELRAIARERASLRDQLAAAERASTAAPAESPGAMATVLRALASEDGAEARQRVVRALVAPGSAVLLDGRIRLTLAVAPQIVPVTASGSSPAPREQSLNTLRIRLVA